MSHTQEVFVYPRSNASVIVEILQKVEPTKHDEIVRFHFDSLAHDNDARSSTVTEVTVVPNDRGGNDKTPSAIVLKGEQLVPKFNKRTPDRVKILMAVFRVQDKNIDVVVTFNIPVEAVDGGALAAEDAAKVESDFGALVKSFRIVDFSLFA
ncbi:hypothetical protein H1R20_g7020, partial [Candolleomyces eurysporus]